MSEVWADEFSDIPAVLAARPDLREAMAALIKDKEIQGKVTEGSDRIARLRDILLEFVNGKHSVASAARAVEERLPRATSPHAGNNRVFPDRWAERLVRTQVSRFYNQAVMEMLLAKGATSCFVPHSSSEEGTSKCSQQLAGSSHEIRKLYDRLISSYEKGTWGDEVKIPDHPYCSHVVKPAA